MLIDRSKFLALSASIAATTLVACSSGDELQNSESNLDEAELKAICGATFSYEEGTCFDLAAYEVAPNEEGFTTGWDAFVYSECRLYDAVLKDSAKKIAFEELAKAKSSAAKGEALPTGAMYDALKIALDKTKSCQERNNADVTFCKDLEPKRKTGPVEWDPEKGDQALSKNDWKDACVQTVRGLNEQGRGQLSACVNKQDGYFGLWSCAEGLGLHEAQCIGTTGETDENVGSAELTSVCSDIVANAKSLKPYQPWAKAHCAGYGAYYKPSVSKAIADCLKHAHSDELSGLRANITVHDRMYACGAEAIAKTCGDSRREVFDWCRHDIVPAIKDKVGGTRRAQDECMTYASALNAAGRAELAACATSSDFLSLYSCVEGLDSAQ